MLELGYMAAVRNKSDNPRTLWIAADKGIWGNCCSDTAQESATTPGAKKYCHRLWMFDLAPQKKQFQHIFNYVFWHGSPLSPPCSLTKQFLPARSCSFGMVSSAAAGFVHKSMAWDSNQVLSCDLMAPCKLYLSNSPWSFLASFLAGKTTCLCFESDTSPAWSRAGGTTVQHIPNTDTNTSRPASSN